jgi:hypothetical protein
MKEKGAFTLPDHGVIVRALAMYQSLWPFLSDKMHRVRSWKVPSILILSMTVEAQWVPFASFQCFSNSSPLFYSSQQDSLSYHNFHRIPTQPLKCPTPRSIFFTTLFLIHPVHTWVLSIASVAPTVVKTIYKIQIVDVRECHTRGLYRENGAWLGLLCLIQDWCLTRF